MSVLTQARWQWTAARYFQAIQSGLIDPRERLELIEGELLRMVPINPRHANVVTTLMHNLSAQLDTGLFHLRVQQPLALAEDTWPEPDLVLVRSGDYDAHHPSAGDTLLVIEVADSSLSLDRGEKAMLYARHAIAEYWVIDVRRTSARTAVYVHRDPLSGRYRRTTEHVQGVIKAKRIKAAIDDITAL
ncbi:MAG: Uma2 family endonuclease [Gammaproteobacteria bacterium]|nr:Uma2 family endonuclease [Gammaproteobacteria bacterium]